MQVAVTGIVFLMAGCDERVAQVAREAADRQAQQNTDITELNRRIAGGSQALVTADAKSREELLALLRDLQLERARLDDGWTRLNDERSSIARDRSTRSFLAASTQLIGLMIAIVLLLGFAWSSVAAAHSAEPSGADLHKLLISELLSEPESFSSEGVDGLQKFDAPREARAFSKNQLSDNQLVHSLENNPC